MNIAILLSGGTGSRLGSDIPKQYIEVNGKMIISYSLDTLCKHSEIDYLVVVVAEEWKDTVRKSVKLDKILFAPPGQNRQLSIYNALEVIEKNIIIKQQDSNFDNLSQRDSSNSANDFSTESKLPTYVFIHDAARPNLTSEMITSYLAQVKGHDGLLPVLSMKDTVYYSEDGKKVTKLIDRSKIYAGQAPEVFNFQKYYAACKALLPDKILSINGSTEPAIIAGMDIAMVPGDENNYKITTRADLEKFENSVK